MREPVPAKGKAVPKRPHPARAGDPVVNAAADFTLRPATEQDSNSIQQLIERVDINTRDLDWRHFLIAEDGAGALIACGQIKSHPGGVKELASIAVAPEWRNRGLARAIIEALLAQHPNEDMYLITEAGMDVFYAKFGFHRMGEAEMPTYFRRLLKLPGFVGLFEKDNLQVIAMKRPRL